MNRKLLLIFLQMVLASFLLCSNTNAKGKSTHIWLIIKNDERRLEINKGYNVSLNGSGKINFSHGGRVIELPESLTILVNEKLVPKDRDVYDDETVRITDAKGKTVWRIAPLPAGELSPFNRPSFVNKAKNESEYSTVVSTTLPTKLNFKIVIDPRVELLSVVETLGKYGLVNDDNTPYRRNVEAYFANYQDHPAVKLFKEMSVQGFIWEVPSEAMTYLSNLPALEQQFPFSEKVKKRAGGEERLLRFIDAFRDFARETKFLSFYEANRGTYQSLVNDTRQRVTKIDYVGAMENYYGMKPPSYTLMLAPLFKELGFASNINRGDTRDVYGVIGPSSIKDSNYVFGEGGSLSLQQLVWHEFSHSIINRLTEKHKETVSRYSTLLAPISDNLKKPYGTWEAVVNEHVIRAITSRLAYLELGKEAGEKELLEHKSAGFIYIEPLYERLKEYETHRGKYRTFDDFYHRLIDVFSEISKIDPAKK